MSDPIAVGVDGTAASRAALEWAARRAHVDERQLVLIHVAGNTSQSTDESDSLAITELDFVKSIAPGLKAKFEVHHGDPVRVLADEAHRFVLLVIGTHKTGFLARSSVWFDQFPARGRSRCTPRNHSHWLGQGAARRAGRYRRRIQCDSRTSPCGW